MPIFGGFCVCSRALGGRWVRWVNMVAFLPSIPVVEDLRALVGRVDTARHHGVPNGCVLEFNLRSVPPETTGFDPLTVLTGGGRPMALRDAVAAIHRAAEDPRVAGLIARVQLPPSPAGAVQELREAIAAFSAVKPSLAWAETYPGTLSYYLASAFGEVWMQPSGSVGLVGFATNATFLRDALHKAGIEAQFVARGEYKSAANLFTEDGFTDAHREAVTRMLDSLQDQVWQAVAKSRNIGVDALDELADRAPLLRDDAVTCGLIDRIGFRDQASTARTSGSANWSLTSAPGARPATARAAATMVAVKPTLDAKSHESPSKRALPVCVICNPFDSSHRGGPERASPYQLLVSYTIWRATPYVLACGCWARDAR